MMFLATGILIWESRVKEVCACPYYTKNYINKNNPWKSALYFFLHLQNEGRAEPSAQEMRPSESEIPTQTRSARE